EKAACHRSSPPLPGCCSNPAGPPVPIPSTEKSPTPARQWSAPAAAPDKCCPPPDPPDPQSDYSGKAIAPVQSLYEKPDSPNRQSHRLRQRATDESSPHSTAFFRGFSARPASGPGHTPAPAALV